MKLKSQSGRSMVEMLGVLAIIGVLTVGGIAGYTFAMNKYRTNEVLDGASKRAITVATQLAVETEPDLTEYTNDNDVAGGTFSAEVEDFENGEFGLKIGNVKKAVCEGLVKTAGGKVALRAIVDQDADDPNTNMQPGDCKDENALFLVFNNSVAAKDAEGSRGSGGSNCWATNSCTADDVPPEQITEEFCNGSIHYTNSYYCLNCTDPGCEAFRAENLYKDEIYASCRAAGYNYSTCACHAEGESIESCTCIADSCCNCLTYMGSPREACIENGYCPAN